MRFKKWILPANGIICDNIYVVEGIHKCFRCQKDTHVIGFGTDSFWDFTDDEEDGEYYWSDALHVISFLDPIPEILFKFVTRNFNYKMRFSKFTQSTSLANCCEHCDVLQGNFFIFDEVDSPFFIYSVNDARNLSIYKFKLKNDLIVDDIGISYGQNDFLIKEYAKTINTNIIL